MVKFGAAMNDNGANSNAKVATAVHAARMKNDECSCEPENARLLAEGSPGNACMTATSKQGPNEVASTGLRLQEPTVKALLMSMMTAVASACGGGPSPDANELCDAIVRCNSSVTHQSCLDSVQPSLDEAVRLGCVDEVNAANRCTLDGFGTSCASDLTSCDAVYSDYDACISAAGGGDFACNIQPSGGVHECAAFHNNPNDPKSVCNALSGTLVDACPSEGILGTCELAAFGGTVRLSYYDPLPSGITIDSFASSCADTAGTWSAP
jgi:hypothetical protein